MLPARGRGLLTCVDCDCPSCLTTTLDEDRGGGSSRSGFAALADPVRLRLVSLMATSADGTACVCELIAPLGKSQWTVSHHLKVWADARVGCRRQDRSSHLVPPG